MFRKNKIVIVLSVVFSLGFLAGPSATLAATAPTIGALSTYGVVSSTFTNSNTSPQTIINGDRCDTTPPTTAPLTTTGTITTGGCDSALGTTQTSALSTLNTQSCTSITGTLDAVVITGFSAGTFPPGCYSVTGAMDITSGTTVTLSGAGVYIFKSSGALTTGASTAGFPSVVLANGASASDVFWAPVGATSLGANFALSTTATFVGNILDAAGISIGHFANLVGRALAFGGTVTTDANTITVPTTLRVIKSVVNTGGGTAVPSDFTLNVKLSGTHVTGSPASGTTTPGTSYSLAAGTYVVSETANSSYTSVISGDCNSSGSVTLAQGDNKTCTITNTFIVGGGGGGGGGSSTGGGGRFAPVPLINITKIPSPLALPGGPGVVTYTYTLTNIGPVAAANIWVKDDKCSPVKLISTDVNKNSLLDTNEVWIYRCVKTVSQTETNAVTAHGNADGWDVYDTASATVVVGASFTPPLIHLVKKPNVFVLPAFGGQVTYAYTVTNLGIEPLDTVSITDDKCTGLPGRVIGHPGDLNKNNLLESSESWSFTCVTNLTKTTTNIGTAVGYANGIRATDVSPATVVVAIPGFPNAGYSSEEENSQSDIALVSVKGGIDIDIEASATSTDSENSNKKEVEVGEDSNIKVMMDLDGDNDALEKVSEHLMKMKDSHGEFSNALEEIVSEEGRAKIEVNQSISEMNSRRSWVIFLVGPDFKNLGDLRSTMVTMENHIDKLNTIKASTSAQTKLDIEADITALQAVRVRIGAIIDNESAKFSLFGWLVKLFQ